MTDPLTLSPVIAWIGALSLVLNFALTLYSLLSSGSRANKTQLDNHSTRLADHDNRLTGVERALRDMPTKDGLHAIELSMSKVRGDVGAMREIMGRMETILARHEEHLLDGGKR